MTTPLQVRNLSYKQENVGKFFDWSKKSYLWNFEAKKSNTQDWNSLVTDSKSIQKISQFIEKLMTDHDKIGKKKVNQKFSNAKKKYSKKICVERKFETEDNTELNSDNYLIT